MASKAKDKTISDPTPNTDDLPQPPPEPISIDVFKLIHKARSNHGVPTEDFNVYRRFLSRKLSALRKELKLQCLDPKNNKSNQKRNAKKNKEKRRLKKFGRERPKDWNPKYKLPKIKKTLTWKKREITSDDIVKCRQSVTIQLFLSERAWSYSRSLYEEYDEDHSRKYHHSNSRLRKAIVNAKTMESVLTPICTAQTALQCAAYCSWLRSSYFLQREELENAFFEYLKWRTLSALFPDALCLENGDEAAVRDKMAYFNQSVDGGTRAEIEQKAVDEVEAMKTKSGFNEQKESETKPDDNTKSKEVIIEFGPHRVSVPEVSSLRTLIGQFESEKVKLSESNKKKPGTLPKLTQMVLTAEKALAIVQKEVAKFTTTSNLSDRANDYLVTERFVNFEKLRFTVSRQCLWMESKLKRGGIGRDHRLLFELATLSERQITNLDEMTGILDLSKYVAFEKQRDILRRRFEISRNYHIAQLLFYWKRDYVATIKVLEHAVADSARHFISEFGTGKEVGSGDGIFDFSKYIDFEGQCKAVEMILNGSKRLILLSKANSILKGVSLDDDSKDKQKAVSLISMKRKMIPILSKPVMMDMAWHFVDYHDVLEEGKPKETAKETKKAPAAHSKRQSSWFGGLFGQ